MKKNELVIVLGLMTILVSTTALVIGVSKQIAPASEQVEASSSEISPENNDDVENENAEVNYLKSEEAKQAVMDQDLTLMDAYGLHYDYAHLSLPEVVQVYLDEIGAPHSSVAFSYKNTETGEIIAMNELQSMTAGSTYKLPLNMLIVDGVLNGQFFMDKPYDIANLSFENESEYLAYRGQFGNGMTISEMQEYSLVYSENTPAYGMVQMLGGFEATYKLFGRYGQSRGDIKAIDLESGNKTTTDYYIQVLDYLWHNQEKYSDILYYLGISFPNQYFKAYLPHLTIYQKPGYYAEALNVDAIVYEETPYLIALYTAGLGGSNAETTEINGLGYVQLTELTYVINQWHRVNQNP
ncbi:serine hydrolase [Streptococcus rifensis]